MQKILFTITMSLFLIQGANAQFKRFNVVYDSTDQCVGDQVTITLDGSQEGVEYRLRDQALQTIGSTMGTGNPIDWTIVAGMPQTYSVAAHSSTSVGLEFDGVNEYVHANIDTNFHYDAEFSFECWAKVPTPQSASYHPLLSIGNSLESDLEVYGRITDLAVVAGRSQGSSLMITFPKPPNNIWYHFAITYDGTEFKVYYDGVEQTATSSTASATVPRSSGTSIQFAGISYAAFPITQNHQKYTEGMMSDMRVWSDVRTSTEISSNKSNCISAASPDLLAYYKINGDLGNRDVLSATGNYDGAMYNMDFKNRTYVSSSDVPCPKGSVTIMGNAPLAVAFIWDTVFVNDTALYAGQDADSYQWLECSSFAPVPGAAGSNRMLVPQDTGDYACVIYLGNCIDTSDCIYFEPKTTTGPGPSFISEKDGNQARIFPNPARDFLKIESDEAIERVEFLNMHGQNLMTAYATSIDISDLDAGIYFIQLHFETSSSIYRLIVE